MTRVPALHISRVTQACSTLGDFVELQRGKTYKSRLLGQDGPYLLGLASIARDGGFRDDNLKTYGGDSPAPLLLRPGDLYVSLKDVTQSGDLLGAVARVPESIPLGRLTQDTVKLILKPGAPPSSYIYWLLRTPEYRAHCRGHATGTTNLGLAREDFLSFVVPPMTLGRRLLFQLLDCIDDKIEQNRRTARALERLARAIFRAWFVDFEPVKAKAAGAASFPSMPQPAFDALPTRLVESEIGLIPEGWEVKPLPEIVEVNPPRQLRKGAVAPYLDMKNMPTEGHAPSGWIEREAGSGMRFVNGDTLVARITPCLENGKTAFVDFLEDGQVAWGSTEYIVLRPKPPVPEVFAYCLTRTPEFREYAIQNMTGTSGRQRVAATALDHYRIAAPPHDLAVEFGAIAQPMFDTVRAAMSESRKLAELRDVLLPPLLSGRLVERRVQGAMSGDCCAV